MPDGPILGRVAARRGPLDGVTPVPGPVTVSLAGPATRLVFRGGAIAADAAGPAFGTGLPRTACTAATAGPRAALWLGPDEWLLLAPPGDGLHGALAAALGPLPCSLVEVSHRQLGLVLEGAHGGELLNAACPLDLTGRAFPPGACTRTVLGKAEVVLWRTGPDSFHLEVWRSLATYAHALLTQAAEMLPRPVRYP